MSIQHHAEAAVAGLALSLLRVLPPEVSSNLGGTVARLIGPYLPVSAVADANLRTAMPALSAIERARIVRGVWDNLGRTAAEFPHLRRLRATPSGAGYEVVNEEVLIQAAKRGGPMLFASGHLGNWEVLPIILQAYGIQMAAMYRAASNPLIDRMILRLRRADMANPPPVFPKGASGARAAMAHLRQGGFLGLLVDQKMNDGIEAQFFGLPAMTAPALAAFALRFHCPVIPGHVERIGPMRFRLIVRPPLPFPETGGRQEAIRVFTQSVNDVLETTIRLKPAAWLWIHRRWPADVVRV